MAQCKLTPQEFIKNSFTPQVAVICSPQAEEICGKNNLTFIQLLQPFCKLGTEAHYRDPTGAVVTIRNFKIALQDINYHPPQPTLARKFLNASVSSAPEPRTNFINTNEYHLEIPNNTPWFESWRDTFLQVQYPSDHEFTKHFVACILVVSSSDKDPVRMMVDLSQKVNDLQQPSKFPKWFNNNVLRYYIILHETFDRRQVHAVECYDAIKTSYGANYCFLLRINSREPDDTEQLPDPWSQFITNRVQADDDDITPDVTPSSSRSFESLDFSDESNDSTTTLAYHPLSPEGDKISIDAKLSDINQHATKLPNVLHGACLTMEDVEQLKLLIHEFCVRALLPFIEKQIHQLSESIANKKGVSRSLFTATKRWFTPSKPGSSSLNTPSYYLEAPELQMRKLGDLYFMFGHYTAAFQSYHTAKRDFIIDQAWLFCAGALEMAALSAFMANETTKKTLDYMEESVTTYLNTCKMAQFATRATLLSSECLKSRSLYGEAALQLIRMTSEESDLRSALLLEQAAYCFLNSTKPTMIRKYAFHMVLAGHRFSKAAQRRHSLRCYKQAYQIYRNKGWNLAEDHIHYTIGRQANHLGFFDEAANSYSRLLTGQSRQSPQQQALFLKEYLTIFNILVNQQSSVFLHNLPIPLLDSDATKILVGPTAPLRAPAQVPAVGISITNEDDEQTTARWNKLEEMLVQEAQGSLPMIFKPLNTLFTHETISNVNPTAILGEPVQVSINLFNPLHILLNMSDVHLLWQFTDSNGKCVANEILGTNAEQYVKTHYLKSLTLQADSFEEIILTITPLSVGEIAIRGICFSLISSINGDDDEDQIIVKGKQIFEMIGPYSMKKDAEYQADRRLFINVVPSAPCLKVSFSEIHHELLRNELQRILIELCNVGSVPLHKVYMATSTPQLLSSCDFSQSRSFDDNIDLETQPAREREARKNHITLVALPNDQLEPGQHHHVSIWIKAPDNIGSTFIDLLIYYENIHPSSVPKYRLVRHIWHLSIQESIKVDVSTHRSCISKLNEQLTLSIKATNMNRIHHAIVTEISVLNAALLSHNWILLDEVIAPENTKMLSQESVHILLKAERKLNTEKNYSMASFIAKEESLRYANSAYLDFAKRNGQNRINVFDNLESFSLDKKKVDATLILRWQANITDSKGFKRKVNGQNDVPVVIIEPEEYIDDYEGMVVFYDNKQEELKRSKIKEDNEFLQRQITYILDHPHRIEHDFNTTKLCIVPIKLILHSIAEDDVEVLVKTLDTISPPQIFPYRPTLFHPHASKHFRWVQMTTVIKTISPLSSTTVQLSMAVLRPGTYDLGSRLEVWCNKPNKPETAVLQKCRIESALIIANTS